MNRKPSPIRHEKGQALVEFALVLPLFVLLLLAVVQFGITFNHYLAVTDAARAGARRAAVARFSPSPTDATIAAVRAAGTDLAQSDLDIQVTAPNGWQRGANVTVSVSYPYSIDLLGVSVKSGHITSVMTERIE